MSDILSELTPGGVAVAVAVLALMAVTVKRVRQGAPHVVRLVHLVDDWAGEPERPGVPARPGAMARIAAMEGLVEHMDRMVGQLVTSSERAAAAAETAAEVAAQAAGIAGQAAESVETIRAQVTAADGTTLREEIDAIRDQLDTHIGEYRQTHPPGIREDT